MLLKNHFVLLLTQCARGDESGKTHGCFFSLLHHLTYLGSSDKEKHHDAGPSALSACSVAVEFFFMYFKQNDPGTNVDALKAKK